MALVGVGGAAQAVVGVHGGDRLGAGDPHREVEQAGRVAPAREHHHDRPVAGEQPVGADLLEHHASARLAGDEDLGRLQ